MDLKTAVTISALLLIQVDSNTIATAPASPTSQDNLTPNNSTDSSCSCSSTTPKAPVCNPIPTSSLPALGVFTVTWKGKSCTGDVFLSLLHSNSTSPLCHDSLGEIKGLFQTVCERAKGCEGTPSWGEGTATLNGFKVDDRGQKGVSCKTLTVLCTVQPPVVPDVRGELKSYKVVTGLLCIVLLVLLLIRFTRPTVKAFQKKLSDRRQSRWIGPTQSQSVSYHRGKGALQNDDGDKRLSYPALDRLTVSTSREPSSNRNSDYNC